MTFSDELHFSPATAAAVESSLPAADPVTPANPLTDSAAARSLGFALARWSGLIDDASALSTAHAGEIAEFLDAAQVIDRELAEELR